MADSGLGDSGNIDTRQGEWIGNAYIKTYDVIIDAFFSKNMAASF